LTVGAFWTLPGTDVRNPQQDRTSSFFSIDGSSAPARIVWAGSDFSVSVVMEILRWWASCPDP
jgi:hypothetical protein